VAKGISDKTNQIFIGPMIKTHLDFVENHLANHTWFLGDQLSGRRHPDELPAGSVGRPGHRRKDRPNITAWVERVHARPAYQAALKKGGEYDFA
jgi:glutathione S-transferase